MMSSSMQTSDLLLAQFPAVDLFSHSQQHIQLQQQLQNISSSQATSSQQLSEVPPTTAAALPPSPPDSLPSPIATHRRRHSTVRSTYVTGVYRRQKLVSVTGESRRSAVSRRGRGSSASATGGIPPISAVATGRCVSAGSTNCAVVRTAGDVEVPLTPVTRRPRLTHPGCTTIKYNRRTNPELEKRRTHFCNFIGTLFCLF